MIAFTGELTETIENFVSQGYFDEVLVTLEDGAVIASAQLRPSGVATRTPARSERGRRLGISNASSMLLRAEGGAGEEREDKRAQLPAQPAVFPYKIAEERYRVFVKVLTPLHEIYVEPNGGKETGVKETGVTETVGKESGAMEAKRQERLYLIGLKRDDLRAQIGGSIEPAGRFGLTVLVLLALLAWPLANLRAKAVEDPIQWIEAVACLISIVLIPAVLAIAAVWVWSHHGVLSWADAGARTYARDLEAVVSSELQRARQVLARYRPLYPDRADVLRAGWAPLRMNDAGVGAEAPRYVKAPISECYLQGDQTCTLDAATVRPDDEFRAWSPFSSVFATDREGRRDGVRYTVFDAPSVKRDANYSARDYFRALQQGQGWAEDDKRDSYFAQRIFSGGDGSRVLQVAVPRRCSKGVSFCGVITGSLSVHSLSAAAAPPLLRFAVIDQRTGQVWFHSDDARSLAENFFVETEHDPRLRALVQTGTSGALAGYYMGAAHRFYHTPVKGTPWSVVAFYSEREAGDLSWHAAVTALAAYSGAMLAILAVSGLVLGAWFKHSRQGVRNFAARFWHRLGSPCSYARWGVAIFGGATVAVLVYEIAIDLRRGADVSVSPITWAMGALALIAWIIVHRQHQRASHGVCIALWLLLVSAAPAAWIALGHQDVQMRGLLRDSLLSASRDVVQRQNAIASDLRRWASNADTRARDFPEARKLAQPSATMPVAGFAAGDCDNARADVGAWTVCVFGPPPLAGLITKRNIDFWRRESWTASAQDETQQRRIELLDAKEASNPSCTSAQSGETCLFQTADGHTLAMSIDLRHGGSPQTVDDETRFEIAMRAVFKLTSFGAVLVLIYLLALFASRRLLGVREKHVHGTGSDVRPAQQAIVFYSRRLEAPAVEKALAAARSRSTTTDTDPTVTRVNLATDALFTELVDKGKLTGVVLLTNIDIALTDAARRRDILVALERLVDDPKVQLLIHSRSSPLERLYHPERYPESGADHTLSLDEALRWDNVLQKLEVRTVSEPEQPRRHAQLAAVDHHRIWKLSTRAERLLLYQLATDRLANPRNHAVIDALIARGLIRLNPWPDIVDPDFEAFVRTAENSKDLAEWQRQASQASGKRVRNTLITVSLVLVLIAVLWFNWSASDQFKIVSAILAASVAFLSQIGQAFNFIRSGAQRSGG